MGPDKVKRLVAVAALFALSIAGLAAPQISGGQNGLGSDDFTVKLYLTKTCHSRSGIIGGGGGETSTCTELPNKEDAAAGNGPAFAPQWEWALAFCVFAMVCSLAMLLVVLRQTDLGSKAGGTNNALGNLSIAVGACFLVALALVADYRNSLDPRTALTLYERLLYEGGSYDGGFFSLVLGFLVSGGYYYQCHVAS